jgi:hypothetical protein
MTIQKSSIAGGFILTACVPLLFIACAGVPNAAGGIPWKENSLCAAGFAGNQNDFGDSWKRCARSYGLAGEQPQVYEADAKGDEYFLIIPRYADSHITLRSLEERGQWLLIKTLVNFDSGDPFFVRGTFSGESPAAQVGIGSSGLDSLFELRLSDGKAADLPEEVLSLTF